MQKYEKFVYAKMFRILKYDEKYHIVFIDMSYNIICYASMNQSFGFTLATKKSDISWQTFFFCCKNHVAEQCDTINLTKTKTIKELEKYSTVKVKLFPPSLSNKIIREIQTYLQIKFKPIHYHIGLNNCAARNSR